MTFPWSKKISLIVNILVFLLCLYNLWMFFRGAAFLSNDMSLTVGTVCFTVVEAVIVNLLKALRLYLILIENRIPFSRCVVLYAETSIVNLLLPYKSGEIYRGFRIGHEVGSLIQGYTAMLFDRFIDTLALVTMVLLAGLFWGVPLAPLFIVFMVFCVIFMFAYCLFPPLYKYLNHFLVLKKSSENTLRALRALKLCNNAYRMLNDMVRGRFLFLYLMSVVAWLVEAGTFVLISGGANGIGGYLSNAMLVSPSQDNVMYFLTCLALFGIVSILIRFVSFVRRKKDEHTRCI